MVFDLGLPVEQDTNLLAVLHAPVVVGQLEGWVVAVQDTCEGGHV